MNNITNRKILLVIIALVVLGVLIAIAIWTFDGRSAQKSIIQNLSLPPFVSSTISQVLPPQTTSMTGMKTYTNTEFGFKFQYPEDWIVQENAFYSPFSKLNLEIFLPKDKGTPNSILINIVTSDFADSVVMNMEKLGAIKENIIISGINGIKYEYRQGPEKDITIDFPFREYRIISGTVKGHEDIYNQILTSFKFLNQTPLNWKTYRNDEYGFTYQYPSNFIFKEIDFPTYTFTDSGEVCKNLLQEEFKPSRLLNQTTLADPSSKFKVTVTTINVYDNADNLSLDEWLNFGTKFLEKHSEECKYDDENYIVIRLGNKKSVTIDNTPGVEGFAGCCMVSNKTIYLAKNGKIYNLTFSGNVNDSRTGKCTNNLDPFSDNKYSCPYISEDVYDQILASFKFLK